MVSCEFPPLMKILLTFIDQQKSSENHPWQDLPSAEEQLTSGHISPFNDGQGFFAQFDPSKAWWDGHSSESTPAHVKKSMNKLFMMNDD